MNKKTNLLIISLALTIGVFIYLSLHHYSLKIGAGSHSLCSISSKINCDAAAASSFSEVLGIPVAVLGASFHLILLGFILFYKLGWVESGIYLKNSVRAGLAFAAGVSLVMGLISLIVVKVACPFCIATYILSFINLYLGWNIIEDGKEKFEISGYFKDYKSHAFAFAASLLIAWTVSTQIKQQYGLDQISKYVPEKIAIWKAGSEYSFDGNVGISNKNDSAKITLVEFADFKCPHCKHASTVIKTFLTGRSDVKFVFKPYPLDGNCNSGMAQKGDGSRCSFAAYALCAEKISGKGLELTHWLFDKQEEFFSVTDAKTLLPEIQKNFGLDTAQLTECADSADTYEHINKSVKEGTAANVEGTPTIYMNGKKLPWGQFLEVLQKAADSI